MYRFVWSISFSHYTCIYTNLIKEYLIYQQLITYIEINPSCCSHESRQCPAFKESDRRSTLFTRLTADSFPVNKLGTVTRAVGRMNTKWTKHSKLIGAMIGVAFQRMRKTCVCTSDINTDVRSSVEQTKTWHDGGSLHHMGGIQPAYEPQ